MYHFLPAFLLLPASAQANTLTVGVLCNAQMFGMSCSQTNTIANAVVTSYNRHSQCHEFEFIPTSSSDKEQVANIVIAPQMRRLTVGLDDKFEKDANYAIPWGCPS